MGCTHYWTQRKNYSRVGWVAICVDIKAILERAQADGVTLWAEYDEPNTQPDLNQDFIRFNGAGDEGHETFYIQRIREPLKEWQTRTDLGWSFCKTAAKPYDVAVVACLAYLESCQGFSVASDSDAEDWAAGVKLARRALQELADRIDLPKQVAANTVSA